MYVETNIHQVLLILQKVLYKISQCAEKHKSTDAHFGIFYKFQHPIICYVRQQRIFLYNGCNSCNILLLTVFLIVNSAISMHTADYSYESKDIRNAQDIMELLSGKIDFTDQTFLGKISDILEEDGNSKESIREVSSICKDKLNSYNLKNYEFSENNVLNNKVLASSGDYNKAGSVDVATRNYGEYSYTLSVW